MWGGLTYSWGVVQLRLVQDKLSSAATLSFIGGVSSACMSIFATLNSNLVRRFGVRNCALVGSMLVAFAQIFSGSTTKNLSGLFVTSGFMMGTGCSILFMVREAIFSRGNLRIDLAFSAGGIDPAITVLQTQTRTCEWHRLLGIWYRRCNHEYHHRSFDSAVRPRLVFSRHWIDCTCSHVSVFLDVKRTDAAKERLLLGMVSRKISLPSRR